MSPKNMSTEQKGKRKRRQKKERFSLEDELLPEKSKKSKLFSKKKKDKKRKEVDEDDPYSHLDPATAAAMRKDDEEIAALESNLGLMGGSDKERKRLYKEYAKMECYGEDFGNFLDDVDTMVMRVVDGEADEDYDKYQKQYGLARDLPGSSDDEDYNGLIADGSPHEDTEEEDEIVRMNDDPHHPDEQDEESEDDESSDSSDHKHSTLKTNENDSENEDSSDEEGDKNQILNKGQGDDSDSGSDEDEESNDEEPDHNKRDTYRPSKGEDIYGNPLDATASKATPKKYIPPHLRKKQEGQSPGDGASEKSEKSQQEEEEKRKLIRRSLNNALNRLSEDTLISVAQAIAKLYQSNPTSIVNECIWRNLYVACIERPNLMTGLIPVYVACLAGVHIQLGDSAQLGEHLLEVAVTDLWKEINLSINGSEEDHDNDIVRKEVSNLMLVVCYLYNYDIVHCSFVYSVVRNFIENFREVEVELLLLILSHCGRALRSDDPLSLKEIVILVQKRALEVQKGSDTTTGSPLSSRVEYMVSAMMDLKNNKKRKKDTTYADKVSKLRRSLGQLKSSMANSSSSAYRSTSDSPSLRIGLEDILDVETKGRWWKVGASWVGNQYRFSEDGDRKASHTSNGKSDSKDSEQHDAIATKEDAKLLKLAAKARMNTDAKRAIFCIIMKSADCEDAFEKLSRAGHLKNRKERDTVRVLMECCGNEKSYNPFYAHLASRLCEHQPQCKFSMQLAFWDIFKQFDNGSSTMSIRKAANLSKLLFHMVVVNPAIRLSVLKVLDLSSPDELTESALIFLTIFFSNIMEYFEDPSDLKRFFESEVRKHGSHGGSRGDNDYHSDDEFGADDDIEGRENDDGGLGPSISIFLLQTLKASPKYKKGSKFRANLKAAVKACDTEDFFF